jgi:hypothetical protein
MAGIWANDRIKFTAEGGLAVRYTNKTGAASVKGYCVSTSDAANDSVKLVAIDSPDCIGVFLDSGVTDGEMTWIVVAGRAYVYFWGNAVRGYLARTGLTADSGEIAGQATSEAVPGSPFNVDKHFCEIGHCLESHTGAGLALVNLHFN